jgi:hypothetical protein
MKSSPRSLVPWEPRDYLRLSMKVIGPVRLLARKLSLRVAGCAKISKRES